MSLSSSSGDERIRAFAALDLDPPSREQIARLAQRLRLAPHAPDAAWLGPSQFHITLKFLGGVTTSLVTDLASAIGTLAAGTRRPPVGEARVDVFPRLKEARVVIAALADPDGAIHRLAQRIDEIGSGLGLARETRAFRPHVTLARLRRAVDAVPWLGPSLDTVMRDLQAVQIVVYESVLEKAGARHIPRERFDFTA